jgi:hypothetical protein
MRMWWYICTGSTSILDGVEWSASHPGHFTLRYRAPEPPSDFGYYGEDLNLFWHMGMEA